MATNITECLTTDLMWQTAIENNTIEIDRLDVYHDGTQWQSNDNWYISFKLGPITWSGQISGRTNMQAANLILRVQYVNNAVLVSAYGYVGSNFGSDIYNHLNQYYSSTSERRFLIKTQNTYQAYLEYDVMENVNIGSQIAGSIKDLTFTYRGRRYRFETITYTNTHNFVALRFDNMSKSIKVYSAAYNTSTSADINTYFTQCRNYYRSGWYILNSHAGTHSFPLLRTKKMYIDAYGDSVLNTHIYATAASSTNYDNTQIRGQYLDSSNNVVNQYQTGLQESTSNSGSYWRSVIYSTSSSTVVAVTNGNKNISRYNHIFQGGYIDSGLHFMASEPPNLYEVKQESRSVTQSQRISLATSTSADYLISMSQSGEYPIFKLIV
jgi:hypothetical protein